MTQAEATAIDTTVIRFELDGREVTAHPGETLIQVADPAFRTELAKAGEPLV